MNGRNGYPDGYPDPGRSNRYDGGYGVDNNNNSPSSAAGSLSGRDRRAGGYGGFYGSPQPSSSSLDVVEQQSRPPTSSSSRPAARRRPAGIEDGGGYGGGGGSSRSVERARPDVNGNREPGSAGGIGDQRITGKLFVFCCFVLTSFSFSLCHHWFGRKERQQWLTTI